MEITIKEGDLILDVLNRIGKVVSISEWVDDEGYNCWCSLVYFPSEKETFTTYKKEIKYILLPTDQMFCF